jgi:hypothetical protein
MSKRPSRRLTVREPGVLHRSFAEHFRTLLVPGTPDDAPATHAIAPALAAFLERERAAVADRASAAPTEPAAFRAWFQTLEVDGPGQHDPLFDYLEQRADLDSMRWFLAQERAGEAGFDDLVALTQVKMPSRPKLELARNYWDEMGVGYASGMHGPMLERLGESLALDAVEGETVWESLALANLMTSFALDRRYAFHAVGALGVVELTAPGRCEKVERGLRRLNLGARDRAYYALHSVIDRAHWRRWGDEVIEPLVAERPELARWIAEGALCRLQAGARLYRRYRDELGLESSRPIHEDRAA